MPVVISEIITETVVAPQTGEGPGAAAAGSAEVDTELIVRRAAERVLEILRREWDR